MKYFVQYLLARPKYPIGKIIDLGGGELGTVISRNWTRIRGGTYLYDINGYGQIFEYQVTDFIKENGDLGCL